MTRTIKAAASAASVAALSLIAGQAGAHHSGAMFDHAREVELKGVVKEFQWTNPHSWIQVVAPGPKGEMEEWSIEGGSPNTLARSGWRPTTFKSGDHVTLRVNPMKDGSKGGSFVGAVLADGRTLGRMGEAPAGPSN